MPRAQQPGRGVGQDVHPLLAGQPAHEGVQRLPLRRRVQRAVHLQAGVRPGGQLAQQRLAAAPLALQLAPQGIEGERQPAALRVAGVEPGRIDPVGDPQQRVAALPVRGSQSPGQAVQLPAGDLAGVLRGYRVHRAVGRADQQRVDRHRLRPPGLHPPREDVERQAGHPPGELQPVDLLVVAPAGVVDGHQGAGPRERLPVGEDLPQQRGQEGGVPVVAVEDGRQRLAVPLAQRQGQQQGAMLQQEVELVGVPVPLPAAVGRHLPLVFRGEGVDGALVPAVGGVQQHDPHPRPLHRPGLHLDVAHLGGVRRDGHGQREAHRQAPRAQGGRVDEAVAGDDGRAGQAPAGQGLRQSGHHVLQAAGLGDPVVLPGHVPDRPAGGPAHGARSGRRTRAPSR